jgi:hypothetical protein
MSSSKSPTPPVKTPTTPLQTKPSTLHLKSTSYITTLTQPQTSPSELENQPPSATSNLTDASSPYYSTSSASYSSPSESNASLSSQSPIPPTSHPHTHSLNAPPSYGTIIDLESPRYLQCCCFCCYHPYRSIHHDPHYLRDHRQSMSDTQHPYERSRNGHRVRIGPRGWIFALFRALMLWVCLLVALGILFYVIWYAYGDWRCGRRGLQRC